VGPPPDVVSSCSTGTKTCSGASGATLARAPASHASPPLPGHAPKDFVKLATRPVHVRHGQRVLEDGTNVCTGVTEGARRAWEAAARGTSTHATVSTTTTGGRPTTGGRSRACTGHTHAPPGGAHTYGASAWRRHAAVPQAQGPHRKNGVVPVQSACTHKRRASTAEQAKHTGLRGQRAGGPMGTPTGTSRSPRSPPGPCRARVGGTCCGCTRAGAMQCWSHLPPRPPSPTTRPTARS
jgi:hypothetical protein